MTRSSRRCDAVDLERDLPTTDEDSAALARHRPTRDGGGLRDLARLEPPDLTVLSWRRRRTFPPQPVFEL